jgi:anti-sigma regulatory factor (Ser/Thr protein kinase)
VPPIAARSVTVPHERHGVALARHAFADEMAAVGVAEEERDDAMLVLSELVSNAVKHAAPLAGGEVRVRWAIRADTLHIEITDGGAATRPNAVVAAVSAVGGRGLDIVRTVCRQWGVTEEMDSVTVWADVPRSSPGVTGSAGPAGPAGPAD